MRRFLLSALACGVLACAPKPRVAPPAPSYNLMEIPVPASFVNWFAAVEKCSGLTGDINTVRFFVAPKPILTLPDDPGLYAGMYFPGERRIVLGLFEPSDSAVVSHELLHFLLDANHLRTGDNQHPFHYFHELCGGVVATPFGT